MSVRLSLAMVAKNHAKTIARALDSAALFCDEMIVVDLGSKDATRDVATKHGATVHAFDGTLAEARDESFARCTGEWIMWLGSDDVVPESAVSAFALFKSTLGEELTTVDVVVAPYHWHINAEGIPSVIFHRERLMRRSADLKWEGDIDEHIAISSNRFALSAELVVEHRPDNARAKDDVQDRIATLEQLIDAGDRTPRLLFMYANALYDQGRFGEAVALYREYLSLDDEGADRYWALVFMAESLIVLEDEPEAATVALTAIGEDSSRAEAYMVLGRIRFGEEAWEEAMPLFQAATRATRPRLGHIREGDYTWGPWDFLAVCHEKLGQISLALEAAERSLTGNPQADRVRANMHLMVDRL